LEIAGVDLIEMNFSQIAVEISTENFTAGVQAIATEAMLEFCITDRSMVGL
tara:strand:- start:202 stop:354 length:153 start_codon:yes stop_codon:yes gene_type:complete